MERRITLAHGAGGLLTHRLLERLFLPAFDNEVLRALDDSALLEGRLALTTDAYVVRPLFFPGGDIGRLAVCGTVNDLAMVGARPLGLAMAFIVEEGFPLEELERLLSSMQGAAGEAGVKVVAGDTKVVEHGAAQGLYVVSAGLGVVPPGVEVRASGARPGDALIVSGPLGDHEVAVLLARGEFALQGEVRSDCAPLNGLVEAMLRACPQLHCLRDPTRGGLATALWEIARASGVGLEVEEERVPVRREVRGVCELLGFDPLYLASEGRLLALCPPEAAGDLLAAMRSHPLGREAALIGRATAEHPGRVLLRTRVGGTRLLEPLSGGQFPRIC